ncbi:hypothetical protein CYMTET_37295 [Cymbomonas tetramitiformis]|uniref:Uncharacterized protein n=1 Tax=Cymbomonas tetramitiformis TaxID=36881 RepID=A0AAE0CE63_9CHLO|nr:hypothetical protein CYMTET_37295 [Cymbomonas tetramitiformis]
MEYVPGTNLPLEGWFQQCLHCGTCTANTFKCLAEEIALCRRCASRISGLGRNLADITTSTSTECAHLKVNDMAIGANRRFVADENVDSNTDDNSPLCEVLLNHHMPRRVGKVGHVTVTTSSSGQPTTRVIYS